MDFRNLSIKEVGFPLGIPVSGERSVTQRTGGYEQVGDLKASPAALAVTGPDLEMSRSEGSSSPVSTAMYLHLLAGCLCLLQQASSAVLGLKEGQSCKTIHGEGGNCTLLSKCRDPGDFRREQPPICSFKGKEPVICCPRALSERLQLGEKASQYCSKINQLPSCKKPGTTLTAARLGIRKSVFGGTNSKSKTRTYMVLIGFGPETEKEWGCGGSLISSMFALSAAHCAKPQILGEARWARLGDLDIATDTDDAKIQERVIVQRILHPGYKEPQVYNDIALFKLNQEVEFTAWVAPVCLHYENNIPPVQAAVTGWGRLEFAGATSNKLQEADLDVFNDTNCQKLLPYKDNKTPRGIDSKLMLCAGRRDGSKDACSGDSGGPLVISKPEQCPKTQIGITSFGSQCGLPDSPGVYTRVSAYITWIEGIVF